MNRPARVVPPILGTAVFLVISFLLPFVHPGIRAPLIAVMVLMVHLLIMYMCIRLSLRLRNPYFRLLALSYALELTFVLISNLAGLGLGGHLTPYFAQSALIGHTTGWLPFTSIIGILLQTTILLIMVMNVILNRSLFRIYGISFFMYLFIISLAVLAQPVLQTAYSLYVDWLVRMVPNHNPSYAIFSLAHSPISITYNMIQEAYAWTIPAATAVAFLAYKESHRENFATNNTLNGN